MVGWVGSGRVGSGRVGSGRVGSGRVGSGRLVGWLVGVCVASERRPRTPALVLTHFVQRPRARPEPRA